MEKLTQYPLLVFLAIFPALSLAALAGLWFRRRRALTDEGWHEDFGVVAGAVLTLLGLIIGFSFSMAIDRYGQRKNLEEGEANAIGTEYLRVGLLPASGAARARPLMIAYLDQRVLFFTERGAAGLARVNQKTDQLQDELWAEVSAAAAAQPTPITALVVAGMNDVFNSRGYTQAAFWNRIPTSAWLLMSALAVYCNAMLGYGSRSAATWRKLALVLPFVVAISFLLIADIDAPRHGLIRVSPDNLNSVVASLRR